MNAKDLIRFAFGDAVKDTPAGPVLMSPEPELADPEPCSCDEALALRAELKALRTELARTRFLSVLRGKLGETWAKMLDRTRAELTEANIRWHSACDVGRRLERRNVELMADVDEAEAKIVDMSKRAEWLEGERAEAKRAAETWEELCHGQEALGRQADALVERFKALALDATAKMNAMEVSMNAAYTERNRLVARLTELTAAIP